MVKFGIYRVEQGANDLPYTELRASDVIIDEGVYKFRTLTKLQAAYPIRHFYVIRLEG